MDLPTALDLQRSLRAPECLLSRRSWKPGRWAARSARSARRCAGGDRTGDSPEGLRALASAKASLRSSRSQTPAVTLDRGYRWATDAGARGQRAGQEAARLLEEGGKSTVRMLFPWPRSSTCIPGCVALPCRLTARTRPLNGLNSKRKGGARWREVDRCQLRREEGRTMSNTRSSQPLRGSVLWCGQALGVGITGVFTTLSSRSPRFRSRLRRLTESVSRVRRWSSSRSCCPCCCSS